MKTLQAVGHEMDALLRGRVPDEAATIRRCLVAGVLAAMFYGAIMGTFGFTEARWPQVVYSSLKVPLLSAVSLMVALPAAYLFFALTGLGQDFRAALTALLLSQAAEGLVLASLSPFTVLIYRSTADYRLAVLGNVLLFTVAGCAGLHRLRSGFAPLIARDVRNCYLLRGWLLLSAFIGLQSSWMLRPFIGDPRLAPVFVRTEGWSNAYEQLWRLVMNHV